MSRLDVPTDVELRRVADVQALVERAAVDALQLDNGVQRARVLGYLAGVALQTLTAGSLEERVAALEHAAGLRRVG